MINVTDSAKQMFEQIGASTEFPTGEVLRLDPVGEGQIGLGLGVPQASDQVVEHNGHEVVRVSQEISLAADGATLDRVDTPQGSALVIVPPGEAESAPS